MTTTLQTPYGSFELQRRPHNPALQAWDAADDYLLQMAAQHPAATALLINDSFGALACALHAAAPVSWSDSYLAHLALQQNWQRNQLPGTCALLPSTAAPSATPALVLWRVPKTQALFAQQIARLHAVLKPETVVLAGGMDKHLLPATKTLLERLGHVDTLPGHKKSHLFRLQVEMGKAAPSEPSARLVTVPELALELQGDANVFAADQLDIGARFFIEQFDKLPPAQRIADLGCGNGVLMLALARARPQAEIHGFDESYQAVACARANWQRNIGTALPARFHVSDGLQVGAAEKTYDSEPFDLILCNPPFHQQHVIGDRLARQLFAQSRQQLVEGGELWVVGNRHLGYRELLRDSFGNCEQVAENKKFVVLRATRRR